MNMKKDISPYLGEILGSHEEWAVQDERWFQEKLSQGFSFGALRWTIFLTSWGVRTKLIPPSPEGFSEHSLHPQIFLPDQEIWIAALPEEEREHYEDWLDQLAPLVEETRHTGMLLFGQPEVCLPAAQGWILYLQHHQMLAGPCHFVACDHCGGFALAKVMSDEERSQSLPEYLALEEMAQTDRLIEAYDAAHEPHLLLQ